MRLLAFLLFLSLSATAQQKDSLSLFFDFNKAELRTDAREALDRWWEARGSSIDKAWLTGHCDAVGSDGYNDPLSERRIAAVVRYLQAKGLETTLITERQGWGERRPLNANATAEERQLNRRVDLFWTARELTTRSRSAGVDTFSRKTVDQVKEGEILRLQNINFYGGRHTFLPQSLPVLRELLQVMLDRPTLEIEIHGHICCRAGSPLDGDDFDEGDQNLSFNRARAVYRYLIDGGIDPARMSFRGFAGRFPLVQPELTDADRTSNRRVEIKIMKK